MAQSSALTIEGPSGVIEGNSTIVSMGRENTIECVAFRHGVQTQREKGTAMATGSRRWSPVTCKFRQGKASPLLMKALCNNDQVTATFQFFRPNPIGDGTVENHYTIVLSEARISALRTILPDCFDPTESSEPIYQEMDLVFGSVRETYADGGVEHEDAWKNQA